MQITQRGINETISKLNRAEQGIASEKPMREAENLLVREARKNTPVDTGALRGSIKAKVTVRNRQITGVVGSNLKYAPAVEKGSRPHFPPTVALEPWARRHGTIAFLVARAISKRGTKGHHMLENALEDNQRRIIRFFEDYNQKVVRDAS